MMDPFFYRNYVNAKTAGLPVGFYHYLTAKNEDGARAVGVSFSENDRRGWSMRRSS